MLARFVGFSIKVLLSMLFPEVGKAGFPCTANERETQEEKIALFITYLVLSCTLIICFSSSTFLVPITLLCVCVCRRGWVGDVALGNFGD